MTRESTLITISGISTIITLIAIYIVPLFASQTEQNQRTACSPICPCTGMYGR
jgi:hypothetical protein